MPVSGRRGAIGRADCFGNR